MLKDDIDSTERLVVDIIWIQDAALEGFQRSEKLLIDIILLESGERLSYYFTVYVIKTYMYYVRMLTYDFPAFNY